MTLPDLINGTLEACGGFFIALSVVKLYRAKIVSGVSAIHVAFFSAWGFWNLFYYPHLGQWASFWGGGFLVAVNVVWLAQMVYYNVRHKRHIAAAIRQGDDFWSVHGIDRAAAENEIVRDSMEADQFGGFGRDRSTPRYRHADK